MTHENRPAVPPPPASRLPPWWLPGKPLIAAPDSTGTAGADRAAVREEDPFEPPCTHPAPHEVRSRPTSQLVAYWCAECETQLEVPDGYEDEDQEHEQDEEDEGAVRKDRPVPAWVRAHWKPSLTGSRTYSRPRYLDRAPAPRQSLIGWWQGMSAPHRWLLYNGAALGAGFAIGGPQFFTAATAYFAATADSWADPDLFQGYGIALGVWMWDYRTRAWIPPFALAARIPLVSLVVGGLLYGTPA